MLYFIHLISNQVEPVIDPLEPRRLLAAAVSGDVLVVEGTASGDSIVVELDQGNVAVQINGSTETFDSGSVSSIRIEGGDGDDSVFISGDVVQDALILGGDGEDCLIGGGGDDTVVGGLGSDTLGGGDEGSSRNTVDFSDLGVDLTMGENTIGGGGEVDTLVQSFHTAIFGDGNDSISAFGNLRQVMGGGGNDRIELVGFTGDLTVRGGSGNDRILIIANGSTGWYFGDSGNDVFTVQRSSATARQFSGGTGVDLVDYRGFVNEFWPVTVSLDDVVNDGSPTEWEGQVAKDNARSDIERVIGTPGPDTLTGGSGHEIFYGMAGNDTIRGGPGNDRIYGGDGNDWLSGDSGNDILYGEAGNDRMFGGDGVDIIFGGPGIDLIRGGLGIDRLIFGSRRGDFRGNLGDRITMLA